MEHKVSLGHVAYRVLSFCCVNISPAVLPLHGERRARLVAEGQGWEQKGKAGSRRARLGAEGQGWEQKGKAGSRRARLGAEGQGWEPPKKECAFGNRGSFDRELFHLVFKGSI